MSFHLISLNSGSNGNCYYVGNENEAVLIDAGISCRETERRLQRQQLSMEKVKAIFISHEHSDHIQGVAVLAKKYQLPVFITSATQSGCRDLAQTNVTCLPFKAFEPVSVGNLRVTAFPKYHDAAEPHSFIIEDEKITIGVFTDIGLPCEHVIHHFKKCHAALLEANYDETMLAQGKYPVHLKRRISGKHGHLSNRQALELFLTHKPPFMSHLLLAHLSKENNHPDLVHNLFTAHAGNTKVAVASRHKETEVYEITGEIMLTDRKFAYPSASVNQLSLF